MCIAADPLPQHIRAARLAFACRSVYLCYRSGLAGGFSKCGAGKQIHERQPVPVNGEQDLSLAGARDLSPRIA